MGFVQVVNTCIVPYFTGQQCLAAKHILSTGSSVRL